MTDPIRIRPLYDGDGAYITPDLARCIVALAGPTATLQHTDWVVTSDHGHETIGQVLSERDKALTDLAALREVSGLDGKAMSILHDAREARDRALADLAAAQKRLADYDDRLTAVMPADYKDWHKNSRNEWPLVAAELLRDRGEQRDEAEADLAAERDAKNRALTCAADYAEEVAKLKADLAACRAELAQWKEALSGAQDNAAQWKRRADESAAQRDRLAGLLRDYPCMWDENHKRVTTGNWYTAVYAALAELEKTK